MAERRDGGGMIPELAERAKWRLLVVFAPYREDGSLQWQQQVINEDRQILASAHIATVAVIGESEGYVDGRSISPESIAFLRREFEVAHDAFALVLADADGSEIARWAKATSMHEVLNRACIG